MSSALIEQLQACAVKLGNLAEQLQQKIRSKCNKNHHYAAIISQVEEVMGIAKQRVELAKALIRAAEKAEKPKKSCDGNTATDGRKSKKVQPDLPNAKKA
ncbi:unnamed protein product [Effrenium voratum]|nr:unnamed protein product [Effrenium voratum]